MSGYKGFITHSKFIELRDDLRKIADTRGLENLLHHLHQPDTDMNDKVCENFIASKTFILQDIYLIMTKLQKLAIKIIILTED